MLRCRFFNTKAESLRLNLEGKRDVMIYFYGENWRGKFVHHPSTLDQTVTKHNVLEENQIREASHCISASLIATDSKDEERCVITMHGEQKEVYAESIPSLGEVRGFVRSGVEVNMPSQVMMSRILYLNSEPVYSIVEGRRVQELLYRGGLANKLWHGKKKEEEGKEQIMYDLLGGGVVLEAAPDSVNKTSPSINAREKLQQRLDLLPEFEAGELPSEYLKRSFVDLKDESLHRIWVAYHCRCSKGMFMDYLKSFKEEDIVDMREKDQRDLQCHFCNKVHVLEDQDFSHLLEIKSAAKQ